RNPEQSNATRYGVMRELEKALRTNDFCIVQLWLKFLPPDLYERQYSQMLIQACTKSSVQDYVLQIQILQALKADRDKKTNNAPFDYWFGNGTLLQTAVAAGRKDYIALLCDHFVTWRQPRETKI